MQNIWMLSPFTTDTNGSPYPTCSAYASGWQAPMWPAAAGTPVSIAHVQSVANSTQSTTSVTTTLTTPITAGNLIMVTAVGGWTGTSSGSQPFKLTCTDSAGNHYMCLQELDTLYSNYDGYGNAFFNNFYVVAPSAVSSITITATGVGSYGKVVWTSVHEYSGVDSVRPLLISNAGYSGLTTNTAGTSLTVPIPVTSTGELVFTVAGSPAVSTPSTLSITSGFTSRGNTTYSSELYDQSSINEWDYTSAGLSSVVFSESGGTSTMWGYAYAFQPKVVATGMGLVYCQCTPDQIAAAQSDSSIVVCPTNYTAPLPTLVTNSYYSYGAINGMSLADLLTKLAAVEPMYGVDPNIATTIPTLPLFNLGVAAGGATQASRGLAANGIALSPLVLPYPVTFGNIYAPATGSDATNLHSWGVYDKYGNKVVAATPRVYPANGVFTVSTTTLPAGLYYIAWTCNGTSSMSVPGANTVIPSWMGMGTSSTSSSGVLPSTVTTPSGINSTPVSVPCISAGLC